MMIASDKLKGMRKAKLANSAFHKNHTEFRTWLFRLTCFDGVTALKARW
jgi:hypothetical protein